MSLIVELTLPPSKISNEFMLFGCFIILFFSAASYDKRWRLSKSSLVQCLQFIIVILSQVLFNGKPIDIHHFVSLQYLLFELFDLSCCKSISFSNNRNDIGDIFNLFHDDPICFADPRSRQKIETAMNPLIYDLASQCFSI